MSKTQMTTTRIAQSRSWMAMPFAFAVALLVFGETLRTGRMTLTANSRWPGDSVSFGYFALAVGLWFSAAGLMQLIRPAHLLLEPSGLAYVGPWWRRHWHWRDVGEFSVEQVGRSSKAIKFSISLAANRSSAQSDDARATIPDGWQDPIEDVCLRLNAARAAWR